MIKSFPKDPPLAAAMKISRTTLHEWLNGYWTRHDIDGELIDLLDRERDVCAERGLMLTTLRQRLVAG